jgi:hypothetical protein
MYDTRRREENLKIWEFENLRMEITMHDKRHTTQGRKEERGKRRIGEVIGLLGYFAP